jgi:hypothetical protein
MTRIVLDSRTLEKLNNLEQSLEVCDEDGRRVAILTPVDREGLFVESVDEIQVTESEVRALQKQPRGRKLNEILADLERSA